MSLSTAQAQSLDPQTGLLDVRAAATAIGFEDGETPNGLRVHLVDGLGAPIEDLTSIRSADALEGTSAGRLGGTASPLMIVTTEGLRDQLGDRRVEVRMWYRAEGARPRAFLIWLAGDAERAAEILNFSNVHDVGLLPLVPSGRVTDDGWRELTSGPVDFLLAHRIAPMLFIDDELRLEPPPFVVNQDGRYLLDGIALYDAGPAAVPDAECTLSNEDQVCGTAGLCTLGRCADASVVDGPAFPRPEDRTAYLARRLFERRNFTGHRTALANLDRYEAEVAEAAIDTKRFWSRFTLAIDHLEDGHASAPLVNPLTPIASGACLQESRADLLPGNRLLPMVYRVNPAHPIGQQLQTGDVLTTVDDEPLDQWRARAELYLRHAADDRARVFVTTPQLMTVAVAKGAVLGFDRCTDVGCAAPQRILIRTASVTAGFWSGDPPGWRGAGVSCNPRFLRLAEGGDVESLGHAATSSVGDISVLEINGTPGNFNAWFGVVQNAFEPAPTRMLLDQRRGDGGSFVGVHWIVSWFFPAGPYPANVAVPPLGAFEADATLRERMFACSRDEGWPTYGYLGCGGALVADHSFLNGTHPAPNDAANTRLALLNGRDGSGNDWLTYDLRYLRATGETRVFGPVPTVGAYGELMGMPSHRIGFAGGSLQMTGGVILGGPQDPVDVHVDGRGVEPDVVIHQSQSDALRGVDTQITAALEWLREE